MFELISQIPFHFTTSLCSLMDPIYYIYHKLYHIFGDHVGHCHQGMSVCAHGGAGRWERGVWRVCLFQMHFFCHLLQIKNSQSQPVKAQWQRWRYDGPINLTPLLYVQTTHLCIKHCIYTQKIDMWREGKIDSALLEMWKFHSSCCIFNLEVSDLNLYRKLSPPPPFRSSLCVWIIHFF